jgi:hypothetical protein
MCTEHEETRVSLSNGRVTSVTHHLFHFRFALMTLRSVNNSTTTRAGRDTSTEYDQETGVSQSNNQVTSTKWRHLMPISDSGPFPLLVKALITGKRRELDDLRLQNMNSKPVSAFRMFELLPLAGATYSRIPLRVRCDDLQSAYK